MAAIARLSEPVITEKSRFAEAWPAASREVVAWLQTRGVSAETAEDVVQEASLRAFAGRLSYEDAADLRRWLRVVSWRLAVDRWRAESRCDSLPMVDLWSPEDVADVVGDRLTVAAALEAFEQLSPAERDAIVGRHEGGDRKSQVRAAVRRHRARLRLLALMEGVAVALLVVIRRLRTTAAVGSLAVATIGVVAVVTWRPGGGVDDDAGTVVEAKRAPSLVRDLPDAEAGAVPVAVPHAAADAHHGSRASGGGEAAAPPDRDPIAVAEAPSLGGEPRTAVLDYKEPDEPVFCAWLQQTGKVCTPPTPAPPDPRDLVEAPAL